jgi:hypothetical protein
MVQNRKTEPAVLGFLGTASGQRQSEISRNLCLPSAQRPDAHGAGQCREISGILITNRSLLFSIKLKKNSNRSPLFSIKLKKN